VTCALIFYAFFAPSAVIILYFVCLIFSVESVKSVAKFYSCIFVLIRGSKILLISPPRLDACGETGEISD